MQIEVQMQQKLFQNFFTTRIRSFGSNIEKESQKPRPKLKNGYLICDALRDLAPFVQFKKYEKHPWRSVTFSKVTENICSACNPT